MTPVALPHAAKPGLNCALAGEGLALLVLGKQRISAPPRRQTFNLRSIKRHGDASCASTRLDCVLYTGFARKRSGPHDA